MPNIIVTDSCFNQLKGILARKAEDSFLRVSVLGGGCSGFQYEFKLDDNLAEDDLVIEKDGARVAIDAISQPFLEDAHIDYKRELIGSRFAVENPNATASCGCGTSFSI